MFAAKYLVIAAAIAGFAAGSAAGGFGAKAIYDRIVLPAERRAAEDAKTAAVKDATDRCRERMTAAISVAAEKAKAAERARLQKIGDAALDQYRAALEKSETALAAARRKREERDRQHEKQIAEMGRSCPLDAGDIDYLVGMRDGPPATAR